jgi:hypothetical protein
VQVVCAFQSAPGVPGFAEALHLLQQLHDAVWRPVAAGKFDRELSVVAEDAHTGAAVRERPGEGRDGGDNHVRDSVEERDPGAGESALAGVVDERRLERGIILDPVLQQPLEDIEAMALVGGVHGFE